MNNKNNNGMSFGQVVLASFVALVLFAIIG